MTENNKGFEHLNLLNIFLTQTNSKTDEKLLVWNQIIDNFVSKMFFTRFLTIMVQLEIRIYKFWHLIHTLNMVSYTI